MNNKLLFLIESLGDDALFAFMLYTILDFGFLTIFLIMVAYAARIVWPVIKRALLETPSPIN